MFDEPTIRQAARCLADAAQGSQVILFGSYARGNAGPDSDLDFLVIEPVKASPIDEYVRLRMVLRSLPIWVDLIVISREEYERGRNVPNTLFYTAAREGITFNEAA